MLSMNKWVRRALLILILLVASSLRFTGIDWDDYDHHHPDERYITWVATTIEWPVNLKTALIPSESSINPYYWPPGAQSKGIAVIQDEQRKFAYGHFPLYLGVAATRLMERVGPVVAPLLPDAWLLTSDLFNGAELVEYRHLTAVTRALSALFDVATVWLLYLLGRRVFGTAVGLLAASFLALNVMHIQLAHFFAFDPYVTFFAVAAVYFMALSVNERRETNRSERLLSLSRFHPRRLVNAWPPSVWYLLISAISVGLAVGSKFAAIMLFLPLLLAVGLVGVKRWLWTMAALAAVATVTFMITNPFALLDLTCEVITPAVEIGPLKLPALDWGSCFLDNIATQGAMVRGEIDLPFTRQYFGTTPYLYYIEMQLRWGMGYLLGLVAFVGFGWATWKVLRLLNIRDWRLGISRITSHLHPALLVTLAWTVPFFVATGGFYVKFMRYIQPITPFLMLYGAAMLWHWRRVTWRWLVIGVVLLATALYALSFINLYQQPHPWTAASQWIFANVEPRTLILSEQWDDALPVTMTVDGEYRRRSEYENERLTWLIRTGAWDDVDKLESNLDLLAQAEYLTIVSNRVYGVVPRRPDQYPISGRYHQSLFSGSLGYEVAAVYGRFPNLLGFYLKPDTFSWPELRPPVEVADYLAGFPGLNWGRSDESFTVYDQPLTIIFRNVGRLSAEEMLRTLARE
jgi:hypothetical protein